MSGTHGKSLEKLYLIIFGCLLVLTTVSVLTSEGFKEIGLLPIAIMMGMAAVKATLVALFFMHLKFEGKWKYILVIPPVLMMIVLILALCPDIARWESYSVD